MGLKKDIKNHFRAIRKMRAQKIMIRAYLIYSISADIFLLLGILYIIFFGL